MADAVLLDLNVFLISSSSEPLVGDSAAIWDANSRRRSTHLVSAASLPTLFYSSVNKKTCARSPRGRGLSSVSGDRAGGRSRPGWPTMLRGSDFEDNLQIACAVEAKLDAIVTRNPKDFAGSPVPVLTPAELLALIAKTPDA